MAFVSQGGIFSVQESLYHGVPILAMPFAHDQMAQAAKVEAKGYGLRLDLTPKLTSKEIEEKLTKVIHDKRQVFYKIFK